MAKEVHMTFTYLPQLAQFIRRTHSTFAGEPSAVALQVLGDMNAAMIQFPAMVGVTFEAETDADHGSLKTEIEINHLPQGGWNYTERVVGA